MKKKEIRDVIVVLLIVIGMFLFQTLPQTRPETRYEVTLSECVDGDTAWFEDGNGAFKSRFLAVNAPELNSDTNTPEAYAVEAKDYVCQLLKQADKIELEEDPKADREDKFGRRLVWVWVDDALLQYQLVQEGYAKVAYLYDDYLYASALKEIEKQAQDHQKGIWKGMDR